jgi:chromosome segregation protein
MTRQEQHPLEQNRLKSVELQGYKTFANRHVFEFAGAITAIVGPNGSGKSNIVDAIRWVLGEQSYSLLRGKKTEDMIFSGSEGRSRAGMAQATVLFDNTDGWLPIDFSEVAITRRAYRDGQNEYLINDQRVRLKDVSELLAKSGLAERTYTIIGQGLVDAALSLRADERRRLFEEAAGIGLYRSRREEAIQRLETTQRNLDRVQDILAELQPRLRSLERQAKRAKEYEQIQEDLRLLLREWYGYHWHRLQQELIEAREYAELREMELEQNRLEQQVVHRELVRTRETINEQRIRVNEYHRQLASFHQESDEMGRKLAVIDERLRSLQQQKKTTTDEQLRLAEEIGTLSARRTGLEEEFRQIQDDLVVADEQLNQAKQELQKRQAERSGLENKIREIEEETASLRARSSQAQVRLGERRAQLARYELEMDKNRLEMETAQVTLKNTLEKLNQSHKAFDELIQRRKNTEKKWETHQVNLREHEQRRTRLQDEIASQKASIAGIVKQLEVLEQAEKSLIGYSEGTKILLEAARKARLTGAEGALSSLIESPVEFEIAITAALGEFLDAVLLNDNSSPDEALDLVQSAGVRSTLLPKMDLKPEPELVVQTGDGVLGVASTLVEVSPELKPVIQLLLGKVIVVKNRQVARQVLKDQESGVRAVTLNGEVFYASGLISATNPGNKQDASGGLSRTRQMRENRAFLVAQKATLEKLLKEQDNAVKELNDHQEAGEELFRKLDSLRADERKAQADVDRLRLTVESLSEQVNWFENRNLQIQANASSASAEIHNLEAEIHRLEGEQQEQDGKQRELQRQLASLPEEEFLEQVTYWHTSQAVTQETSNSLEKRIHDLELQLARLQLNQEQNQGRSNELEHTRLTLEQEKIRLTEQIEQVAARINEIQELVKPAEVELSNYEKKQVELEKQEEQVRTTTSAAEHRHAQARINFNKQQDALESLRRRIEDDFGLVEFEYENIVSGPTPLPLDGMVEKLPVVKEISPELEESLTRKRAQLRRMGAINPEAQREYREVKQRYEFMTSQVADLHKAESDIRQVIHELDELMRQQFTQTFTAVASEFKEIFARLFGGGAAQLILTDPSDVNNTGIDIEARLPGRRLQGLSLLSGGERSLTAAALVFALLKTSPTPFCVLDEVDAMLDEANVGRFRDLLRELSGSTQFIIITHNRNTVQAADVIYGVTMGKDSTSQVLSLRLDQVAEITENS